MVWNEALDGIAQMQLKALTLWNFAEAPLPKAT
jgi:hypothetical protein